MTQAWASPQWGPRRPGLGQPGDGPFETIHFPAEEAEARRLKPSLTYLSREWYWGLRSGLVIFLVDMLRGVLKNSMI